VNSRQELIGRGDDKFRRTLDAIGGFVQALDFVIEPMWADFNEAGLRDEHYNPEEFKYV